MRFVRFHRVLCVCLGWFRFSFGLWQKPSKFQTNSVPKNSSNNMFKQHVPLFKQQNHFHRLFSNNSVYKELQKIETVGSRVPRFEPKDSSKGENTETVKSTLSCSALPGPQVQKGSWLSFFDSTSCFDSAAQVETALYL